MNCPLCGEVCRGEVCWRYLEPFPSAVPQWRTDAGDQSDAVPSFMAAVENTMEVEAKPTSDDGLVAAEVVTAEESTAVPDPDVWRDEISARLNRFRSATQNTATTLSLTLSCRSLRSKHCHESKSRRLRRPRTFTNRFLNHAFALTCSRSLSSITPSSTLAAEAAPRPVEEPRGAFSAPRLSSFPDSHGAATAASGSTG